MNDAVDSAIPSMNPTAITEAPSTLTMYRGSRAWIISEEMSINIDTKPSAQMLRGIFGWLLAVLAQLLSSPRIWPLRSVVRRNCRCLHTGCKSDRWMAATACGHD
ncbi:hypothetical protein D9M71_700160 [compost metagenome]